MTTVTVLTITAAAEYLQAHGLPISRSSVYQRSASGEWPFYCPSGMAKRRVIQKDALDAILAGKEPPPAPSAAAAVQAWR